MVWETRVQSQIKFYQRLYNCYLIPTCLTFSNIRYVSRVKWSNPGKGVASSPTPQCSSHWKGSLLVTLDYSCQLYFLLYIYIYIYIYCHLQTDCSVASHLFSVARHARCFKLRSKCSWFYISQLSYPRAIVIFSVSQGIFYVYIYIYILIYATSYRSAQFMRRALHLCICGSQQFFHPSAQPSGGSIYIVIPRLTVSLYHYTSV